MDKAQRIAVLVIDLLNDYFADPPLSGMRAGLVANVNALVRAARRGGHPVIWVRQEFKPDLSDAFLRMRKERIRVTIAGTLGAQCLPELDRAPSDHEIVKKRYSAFFGTSLDDLLERLKVTGLVVCGINTHACVRMTAIDAYQRDIEVVIPREGVASRDPEHHEVTLRYLGQGIAEVRPIADVIATLGVQVTGARTERPQRR